MSPNSPVENIIYVKHTSTSIEIPCLDGSNCPDNLANIMKNNIVVWQNEPSEDEIKNEEKS